MAVLLEAVCPAVGAVFLNCDVAVTVFDTERMTRARVRGPARMIAIRAVRRLDVVRIALRRHLRFLLRV
jgi:hypothetical protein